MNKITILLLVILTGFVIVALPDAGDRLFSISKKHGPSLQDAAGLLLIFVSYIMLVAEAWKKKEKILKYKNSVAFNAGLSLAVVAYALIIVSVVYDLNYWWIYGTIFLIVLHAIVFYIILK